MKRTDADRTIDQQTRCALDSLRPYFNKYGGSVYFLADTLYKEWTFSGGMAMPKVRVSSDQLEYPNGIEVFIAEALGRKACLGLVPLSKLANGVIAKVNLSSVVVGNNKGNTQYVAYK